jgi:hypothetical protein
MVTSNAIQVTVNPDAAISLTSESEATIKPYALIHYLPLLHLQSAVEELRSRDWTTSRFDRQF